MQADHRAAQRLCRQIAQPDIAFLCPRLHGDFLAKRLFDHVIGPQMHDALIAVHQNAVAVQRLGRYIIRPDHQWNCPGAGDDGGVAPHRPFLQHDAFQDLAIFQQFTGADIAGDQHRIFRHLQTHIRTLPGQNAQQLVGDIVQIMQPFAQVLICRLIQPRPGQRLFLFHRSLGGQARLHVILHPAQPAARMGEHPIRLKDFGFVLVRCGGAGQHVIDRPAQFIDRIAQADHLFFRIVRDRVGDHDAGFVQVHPAFDRPFLPLGAPDHHRALVPGRQGRTFAGECPQFGHFGQHHGHHFQCIDLVGGKFAGGFVLYDQHAQRLAQPLHRDAAER